MRARMLMGFVLTLFIWGLSSTMAGSAQTTPKLFGNRFLTFTSVIRVRQIETTRDSAEGPDETSIHSPEIAQAFRDTLEKSWPGARMTWAFSWLALKDQRPVYKSLRERVVSFYKKYGDEITFIPGGFFANMYSSREQVNRDLHDALKMVSEMVGNGYRPQSVIAGFLAADNLQYLSDREGIKVCQGNIWSQHGVDNGDGDGSMSYPYYPSREHFLKPAQGRADQIDCVNLDGWTCDFLNARRAGGVGGFRSRLGVGPIETVIGYGLEKGVKEMMATTAAHFDEGFKLNKFGWVTSICELGLVKAHTIYGYKNQDVVLPGLEAWFKGIRSRWPDAKAVTVGEFGLAWRKQFKQNDAVNYRFVQRGSGLPGSESNLEIRWFMNKDFRLALLRDWTTNSPERVIDFTRYDFKAEEPQDPKPGEPVRNWSLMNRINQKGLRPQDKPVPLEKLSTEDQALINRRYPELIAGNSERRERSTSDQAVRDAPAKTLGVQTQVTRVLEEQRAKELPVAGTAFTVQNHLAFLIMPKKVTGSAKTPWVWYAPTFRRLPGPEEKWMIQKFLDAGIAIAGIDVGESYGSPAGRALFSSFYDEVVKNRGLSKTPCLLARSRGGLMLYNWAVEHPSSVAGVAGIYPVCDLVSFPGIARASGAYGMTVEQLTAKLSEHNPIDRLKPLARAKVPIYHIHGDSDSVVPLDKNSDELARRYRKLGGQVTLNVIKGKGHDMWPGWFECQELVDFVIAKAIKGGPIERTSESR